MSFPVQSFHVLNICQKTLFLKQLFSIFTISFLWQREKDKKNGKRRKIKNKKLCPVQENCWKIIVHIFFISQFLFVTIKYTTRLFKKHNSQNNIGHCNCILVRFIVVSFSG